MTTDVDTLIIGAGVIGIAVAREISASGKSVIIIEKELTVGTGVSSRNSEVIHAGIYNPQNFLKTTLCIQGKELLYEYATSHHIPFKKCGKLIVATKETQLVKLQGIYENAHKNGVDDLVFLDNNAVKHIEPELLCHAALYSPSTGIIDSHQLMLSLLGEVEGNGGAIAYNAQFIRAIPISTGFQATITTDSNQATTLSCRNLINCAGLSAQDVAQNVEGLMSIFIPELFLVKGNYFSLSGNCPFKHLVYPVPEKGGLGTHLTLDMQNQARFGPDVENIIDLDYKVDENRRNLFYENARKFFPKLKLESLQPAYSGIRPKIGRTGDTIADFVIQGPEVHKINGLINLFGIESPGLTASLAIAKHVDTLID